MRLLKDPGWGGGGLWDWSERKYRVRQRERETELDICPCLVTRMKGKWCTKLIINPSKM